MGMHGQHKSALEEEPRHDWSKKDMLDDLWEKYQLGWNGSEWVGFKALIPCGRLGLGTACASDEDGKALRKA